jgi:hypothetical protein
MLPGDILAVRGRGWLSDNILKATGGKVSHVGMFVSIDPPIIIEALTRVRTRPLAASLADVEAAWSLTDHSLTTRQRQQIIEAACSFSADAYGYPELGLQLLDALTRTTWWTDRLSWTLKGHPICSFLVAAAYGTVGLNFGKLDQSVTPADIFRFAEAHPDIYGIDQTK